jgi:hypothetical protein
MADNNNDIEQKIKLTYETNANTTAKDVDKLDKSIEKTTDSQKESTKQAQKQKQSFEDLGGGIGATITGFKGLIKQAWLLVANPVGLVITAIALALTGLFKAFTSTNEGADKMEQIMAGLGAVLDILRDKVLKAVEIFKKFWSGDVVGAFKDAKAEVAGFGDEVAAEFRKAADATKSLQEVEDAMRSLGVERAKLNRDLVEAKEIIDDENASYADKVEALKKVTKAEEEQTKKELANAQKKLDAIRELNALSDTSDEDLKKEADAETALYNIQEQSARDRVKNQKLFKKADAEEKARLKEITRARQEAAKERAKLNEEERKQIEELAKLTRSEEEKALRAIQDLNDKTEEEKLARKKERDLEEIEALRQKGVDVRNLLIYNDELYNALDDELREKRVEEKIAREEKEKADQLERDKKFAEEQAAIEKAKLEQLQAIENAKKGLLNGAVNLAKDIFSKNKKVQKGILIAENAAALAKVTMNTVEAVSKDNAASPLTFGMPWSGIHIGQGVLGAASIIKSTSEGLKALGGGSAGSAPQIGGGGGGASAAPQVGFQASRENQIATTIATNTNEQPPVKAYVVTSEVTTGQALDRNKIEENSFGG